MILEKVAKTMGAVRMERPEGRGRRNRGEEEEAGTELNMTLEYTITLTLLFTQNYYEL